MAETQRAHWGSRWGFVLAAAGSAVGLGNIWKFPYITGHNGGGLFVLVYLVCIAVVGLPIMMAEIMVGRTSQKAPVGAFRSLSAKGSPWILGGWLGVLVAFIVLSFYSVVAGWAMHYCYLSVKLGGFSGMTGEEVGATFGGVFTDTGINIGWHIVFMILTMGIVIGGIRGGVERAAKILMPLLMLMMVALLIQSMTMKGFGEAFRFIFAPNLDAASDDAWKGGASILEALGHAFFTLSLGMGAMITYGSYLRKDDDLVTTSLAVGVLDTVVALLACLVIFPIIFSTEGLEPGAGPGLVFVSLPTAFASMPGGMIWSLVFFALLTFAALTSGISLLEVAVSYFIDELGWSRVVAVLVCGITILLLGVPSALSGSTELFGAGFSERSEAVFGAGNGKTWFDLFDYLSSNWMLPLGGLVIALFVAWRVGGEAREHAFKTGTTFDQLYWGWVFLLRYIVPVCVLAVFLNAIGVFSLFASDEAPDDTAAPAETSEVESLEGDAASDETTDGVSAACVVLPFRT